MFFVYREIQRIFVYKLLEQCKTVGVLGQVNRTLITILNGMESSATCNVLSRQVAIKQYSNSIKILENVSQDFF